MKNVTISLDDDLAQRIRVAAAQAGQSVSRCMADAGREKMDGHNRRESDMPRNLQLEALERVLAGPKWDLIENGRMPTREERNARR